MILAFAHYPGSSNVICPVLKKLKGEIYALEPAYSIAKKYKIKSHKLSKVNYLEIKNIIKERKPTLIITGLSYPEKIHKFALEAANELNIKTISILDFWGNNSKSLTQHHKKYLPTIYCVPDNFSKKEAIKSGIPKKIIKVTGSPHFEEILKKNKLNRKPNQRNKYILFASQPHDIDFPKQRPNQFDALELLIKANNSQNKIIVAVHPRDNIKRYNKYKNKNVIIKNKNSINLLKKASIVVSLTSTMLIEASLMNKPSISIFGGNKFIEKHFPVAKNETQLKLLLKQKKISEYKPIKNATKNILKLAQNLLVKQTKNRIINTSVKLTNKKNTTNRKL